MRRPIIYVHLYCLRRSTGREGENGCKVNEGRGRSGEGSIKRRTKKKKPSFLFGLHFDLLDRLQLLHFHLMLACCIPIFKHKELDENGLNSIK